MGPQRAGQLADPGSWFYGGVGEMLVAGQLRALPAGWFITHDIEGEGWNIDHIVVGPPGVFVLNTKCHPSSFVEVLGDTVLIQGKSVPYVSKADRERQDVDRRLQRAGIPVRTSALVVVLSSMFITTRAVSTPSVQICSHKNTLTIMRRCRARLAPEQVHAVVHAVRDRRTWS